MPLSTIRTTIDNKFWKIEYSSLEVRSRSAIGSKSNCLSRRCEFVPALPHTFVDIDQEIFYAPILLLSLTIEGL